MPLTAVQIRNAALDSNQVEEQLAVIMALQARAVLVESGATANHAAREAYAKTVLLSPTSEAQAKKWLFLTAPEVAANAQGAPTPASLVTAVAASWDLASGV